MKFVLSLALFILFTLAYADDGQCSAPPPEVKIEELESTIEELQKEVKVWQQKYKILNIDYADIRLKMEEHGAAHAQAIGQAQIHESMLDQCQRDLRVARKKIEDSTKEESASSEGDL